jgi:DNA-binding PadR family transcriptional regulator
MIEIVRKLMVMVKVKVNEMKNILRFLLVFFILFVMGLEPFYESIKNRILNCLLWLRVLNRAPQNDFLMLHYPNSDFSEVGQCCSFPMYIKEMDFWRSDKTSISHDKNDYLVYGQLCNFSGLIADTNDHLLYGQLCNFSGLITRTINILIKLMPNKMKTLDNKLRARKHILLGQIEQVVLLAILHRLNRAYGIEINKEIEVRTGIKLTVGALYSTLDRMEQKGLINCVDSELSSNSRSRRYFSVTIKGRQLLNESIDVVQKMRGDVDILVTSFSGTCLV